MPSSPAISKPRGPDTAAILAALKKFESAYRMKVVLAVIAGAALSFVGPLFLTGIIWLFAVRYHSEFAFWHGYLIIAICSMPIFYLLAAAVKGSVLESAAEGGALDNRFVARRIGIGLILAELANIGPRLVVYGWRKRGARRAAGQVDLSRVAAAVAALAVVDGSIGPVKLLQPGESPDVLEPLLGFLLFYDIADVSKAGDRVWLSSGAKAKLLPTK
jgi:hypothetical protein